MLLQVCRGEFLESLKYLVRGGFKSKSYCQYDSNLFFPNWFIKIALSQQNAIQMIDIPMPWPSMDPRSFQTVQIKQFYKNWGRKVYFKPDKNDLDLTKTIQTLPKQFGRTKIIWIYRRTRHQRVLINYQVCVWLG